MQRSLSVLALSLFPLHGQLVPSKIDRKITIPEGLTLTKFADQSQVHNATTLCLDGQNRVYVAETHRWRQQVQDIRYGGQFLRDRIISDISSMKLEDRTAFHKRWAGKKKEFLTWKQFRRDSEVIKRLEDTDDDGVADKMTVFRDDFNQPLDGPSGGLIERDGTVYFAMIPGVYSLRDLDNDGKAEEVKTLVNGFGVRVSFSGHDLNGFAWGPDGKIYWSIGDRGYHIEQNGKTFSRPDSGGVFRSNPDGSEFEEFYVNLRNPKEIVFDEYGNLFTVDNDYDHGDRERIVYLIEHGDSGWKMGYQTIATFGGTVFPHAGGKPDKKEDQIDAWMNEGLWNTRHDRQPAYINPPIAYAANGPCGLAYDPGVIALPDRYKGNFFVASYKGSPNICFIERFTLEPEGATFKLGEQEPFLKGIALTDVDWGYDGKLYISDYGGGWGKPEKGAVYTLADPEKFNNPEIKEVRALFAKGIPSLDNQTLAKLLTHPDQRVRLRAQFALADKGNSVLPIFQKALAPGSPLLGRLHGIWGIGQLAQKDPSLLSNLSPFFQDNEMEVRANLARTLSNHSKSLAPFRAPLIKLLADPSPRVASLAGIALANHGHADAVKPALTLIEKNNDVDVVVRHAGIMVLAKCATPESLTALNNHSSKAVRLAAVVALRRQKSPALANFFDDADTMVRQEAIRAAYDMDLRQTYPALAARAHQIARRVTPEVKWHPLTARRALYAAWTMGQAKDLATVASLANDPSLDFRVRKDALIALLDWNKQPAADPVVAFIREHQDDRVTLDSAILAQLSNLTAGKDEGSRRLLPRLLTLVEQDKLKVEPGFLFGILRNQEALEDARVKSLGLLARSQKKNGEWPKVLEGLFADSSQKIRSTARELLFKIDPDLALARLGNLLSDQSAGLAEKQFTLETLAKLGTPNAKAIIAKAVAQLTARKAEPGLALDIVMAAETAEVSLEKFRASLAKDDPNAEWKLLCETGGDISLGRKVFYEHGAAQCQRCHTMHGVGGKVGPELGAIGKNHDAAYLLRSLVDPGAEIAPGYGLGTIKLKNGKEISGNFLPDDADGNAVISFGEITKVIKKSEIASKSKPLSAMPPMTALMSKKEARDLVAYLASCKKDKTEENHK
jgi:quinoprotein glucose dehydrogenase